MKAFPNFVTSLYVRWIRVQLRFTIWRIQRHRAGLTHLRKRIIVLRELLEYCQEIDRGQA